MSPCTLFVASMMGVKIPFCFFLFIDIHHYLCRLEIVMGIWQVINLSQCHRVGLNRLITGISLSALRKMKLKGVCNLP